MCILKSLESVSWAFRCLKFCSSNYRLKWVEFQSLWRLKLCAALCSSFHENSLSSATTQCFPFSLLLGACSTDRLSNHETVSTGSKFPVQVLSYCFALGAGQQREYIAVNTVELNRIWNTTNQTCKQWSLLNINRWGRWILEEYEQKIICKVPRVKRTYKLFGEK